MTISPCLNAISSAVPSYEAQGQFLESLVNWVPDPVAAAKLRQIAAGAGIERRYTVLAQPFGKSGSGAFYEYGAFPTTQARMRAYQHSALPLALKAVHGLGDRLGPDTITHLILTSCTGFYAPGLDIELVRDLGLPTTTKRSLLGFMGCYAGLTALRNAREIVQAQPSARVLVVNVELCSLHLQPATAFDRLVSFLLFADGAAASIVSAETTGLRLDSAETYLSLADADRMAWEIEDSGFAMTLDARVPQKIKSFIERHPDALGRPSEPATHRWAIHPGGKAILDAVQAAYAITEEQMAPSREVLRDYGNMSSVSVLFALEKQLRRPAILEERGTAFAFGPGLTLECLRFTALPTS
jgi:alpha-pyrone synthase